MSGRTFWSGINFLRRGGDPKIEPCLTHAPNAPPKTRAHKTAVTLAAQCPKSRFRKPLIFEQVLNFVKN